MNDLDTLMSSWLDAKSSERKATATRIGVENSILAIHKAPEEGSETLSTKNYKATLTQNINRKIDERKASQIIRELPDGLTPINIVESMKLDILGLRWLQKQEPGMYRIFCECLTEKKTKVNFKIEVIK